MKIRAGIVALLAPLLGLSGCITQVTQKSEPEKPVIVEKPKPKIGLALGGGAARGFAHVGVIKVLERNGIKPDFIVGTSAGAVVGSLYAGGLSSSDLQRISTSMDETVFADWGLPRLGVLKGEALADYVNQSLNNRNIEKLNTPFAAVATNLHTGEMKIFKHGNVGEAVRASASVPGLFQPAAVDGQLYVDGGLVSPVPVYALRQMGADFIIAVDISTRPRYQPVDGIINILWQTISIMGSQISSEELKSADVLIVPDLPYIKSWDFNARNLSMLEGERAAMKMMPMIKQKLQER